MASGFGGAGVTVMVQRGLSYTPTPVISHAILTYNATRKQGFADGIVITPSHNPPEDGGFKYNPPEGGPASPETTKTIEDRANDVLKQGVGDLKRVPFERALTADTTNQWDYITPYVRDLQHVIDMEVIAKEGLLKDLKRRQSYEKPGARKRRKQREASRRRRRQEARLNRRFR